jgi:hypothetical protein
VQEIYEWCHAHERYLRNERPLARVPFELVHDRNLDPDHPAGFRTLVLPNVAALSDAQCAQLGAFVRAGGGLVATYEASLFDEAPAEDFGLAELFGASFAGRVAGPVGTPTCASSTRPRGQHELLRGLEDAPRIIHGVWHLEVTPRRQFPSPPVTLIPAYPDLPMEKVYVRQS